MPRSQIFRTTKSMDFSSLLFSSCHSSFLLPLLLTPCLPLQMMSSKECQEKTASESRLGSLQRLRDLSVFASRLFVGITFAI